MAVCIRSRAGLISSVSATGTRLAVALLASVVLASCQTLATPDRAGWRARLPTQPALACELIQMADVDQAVRAAWQETGSDVASPLGKEVSAVDKEHTKRLKEIVRTYGWPGVSIAGVRGSEAAWLIAQHATADLAFQEEVLVKLREAVARGDALKGHLALLEDRVRMQSGRPQLYGSQMQIVDGKLELVPIEDPQNVDTRRAEMGLGSLADYVAEMRKQFERSIQK